MGEPGTREEATASKKSRAASAHAMHNSSTGAAWLARVARPRGKKSR